MRGSSVGSAGGAAADVREWYGDPARLEADIRSHSREAVGSYADRVDLAAVTCSTKALGLLRTIHALETSTLEWLRVVLVSPTHSDAQVTAFLCTWAYERHWIAATLADLLVRQGATTTDAENRGHWGAEVHQRLVPIGEALRTNLIGDDVVAVHLVEAAVGEALGQTLFRRLGELEPGLTGLCDAIRATKQIHLNYFRTRAAADLSASSGAQRLTRRHLRRLRWPSAGPAVARTELDAVVDQLFTAPDRWDDLRHLLDALPGLAGVRAGRRRHRIVLDVPARS